VLRAESSVVGTTVAASGRQLDGGTANVIVMLRGEHMIVPNASTQFEASDGLIVVTTVDGMEQFRRDVAPW